MNQDKYSQQKYGELVKQISPNSPIVKNCIKAFFIGGLICIIGQFVMNSLQGFGLDQDSAGAYTTIIMIFLGVLLTGLNLYGKIGKFAGAGSIVPITGFANAVASPAMEFKKEGFILGLGAKLFVVAGPVIVYGVTSSVIVGLIYYAFGGGAA